MQAGGGDTILFIKAGKFKVTSMKSLPFNLVQGTLSISYETKLGPSKFSWNLAGLSPTGQNKSKSYPFSADAIDTINSRGNQFTFIIRHQGEKAQFIGGDLSAEDNAKLIDLMERIRHKRYIHPPNSSNTEPSQVSANKEVPLDDIESSKENMPVNPNPVKPRLKSGRTPLGEGSLSSASFGVPYKSRHEALGVKDSTPHPTTPLKSSLNIFKNRVEQENTEDDVAITAIGGSRSGSASSFYGGTKGRSGVRLQRSNMLMKRKPLFQRDVSSNTVTFQQRNAYTEKDRGDNQTLVGFSNLGNTCYMNAILQCLLGMPCFSQDLISRQNLNLVPQNSLYSSLCHLAILKNNNQSLDAQKLALRRVKRAISSAANRFSGFSQHDAHEFLCQCLDQLKEDLALEIKKFCTSDAEDNENVPTTNLFVCPVRDNFECSIQHTIKCLGCEEVIKSEETCHDFSLVIPETDENTSPMHLDLQALLDLYFMDENIEYTCEKCKGANAVLSHYFSKLPQVIILHVKRYEYLSVMSKDCKKTDEIRLPLQVNLGYHALESTSKPKLFVVEKEKMTSSEYRLIINQNIPSSSAEKRKTSTDAAGSPPQKMIKSDPIEIKSPVSPCPSSPSHQVSPHPDHHDYGPLTSNITPTEGEQMAWAFRESKKITPIENSVSNFTKLKSPPKKGSKPEAKTSLAFHPLESTPKVGKKPESNDIAISTDHDEIDEIIKSFAPPPSLEKTFVTDDEDEELKKVLSMSALPSVSDDEDEQMRMAMELSLQEYQQQQQRQNDSSDQVANELPENVTNELKENVQHINEQENKPPRNREFEIDEESSEMYKLVGIVNHIGQNTRAGHYLSDVYDFKSKSWHSYDDSSVKGVTEHEVRFGRQQSAYIVFYMHDRTYNALS